MFFYAPLDIIKFRMELFLRKYFQNVVCKVLGFAWKKGLVKGSLR